MEIVLVRHGQPEWIKDDLNVDNPPLTELGFAQSECVAKALEGEHFDEIWVSPLVRAQQTAAPLLARRKISAGSSVTQNWLEEIRNPLWHGTPREKADAAYREERSRIAEKRWDGLTDGEPVRDFVTRIHKGAETFLDERGVTASPQDLPVWHIKDPDRKILCVAHAGTNSVFIGHILGLAPTPWEWERLVIGHASVSVVETLQLGDGITFGLTQLSGLEHLPVASRTY